MSKKSHLIIFCSLMMFYFVNSTAQTFNLVGCKAPYQTIALGIYKNQLVHSGFDTVCGVDVKVISTWNDTTWNSIGLGVPYNDIGTYPPAAFTTYKGDLIVGGGMHTTGGKIVNGIARWDGTEWYPLGSGMDERLVGNSIRTLAVYKGDLYAAGTFRRMNGTTGYNNIARWDGSTWHKVGNGITRNGVGVQVNQMVVYKDELYVGGYFDVAGVTTAYNIARWNGITWNEVGNGMNGPIYAMEVDTVRNVLYAAGGFSMVDDSIIGRIGLWNGENWQGLSNNNIFNHSAVYSLEMYHGFLYAGSMDQSTNIDTTFSRWNGVNWEIIYGPNSNVYSLQTFNDELYVGGIYTMIGNDSIPYLARYYSSDSVVVGTNNIRNSNTSILLYPNPVVDVLNIEIDNPILELIIFDLYGKVCTDLEIFSNKQVNVNKLSSGSYFIKILTRDGKVYHAKFVKL